MTYAVQTNANLISRLREVFFDVTPEGTLVYLDPAIGALQNRAAGVDVHVNVRRRCLELRIAGVAVRQISFAPDLERACAEAFGAYFQELERIYRSRTTLAA